MGSRIPEKTGGFISMKVVLYSNGNQECERVKQLLKSVKGEFLEYLLNDGFTQQQFDMEFGGDATYPQIQIDAKHVGTLKDTLHYLQECGKI
jgi:glutaredoxin